jgi:hypothetical protein
LARFAEGGLAQLYAALSVKPKLKAGLRFQRCRVRVAEKRKDASDRDDMRFWHLTPQLGGWEKKSIFKGG